MYVCLYVDWLKHQMPEYQKLLNSFNPKSYEGASLLKYMDKHKQKVPQTLLVE